MEDSLFNRNNRLLVFPLNVDFTHAFEGRAFQLDVLGGNAVLKLNDYFNSLALGLMKFVKTGHPHEEKRFLWTDFQ